MAGKKTVKEPEKIQELAKTPEVKKGPVMYLGPTVTKIGLKNCQLFSEGIPAQFDRVPLNRLFAEPMEINRLKKSIVTTGTAANLAYADIAANKINLELE